MQPWFSGGSNYSSVPLQLRHNWHDSVSNHQPHNCLLNHLFGRRSKKTSKLRVTGLLQRIHREPVNSPHKWSVTRKMFPFDDVIMIPRLLKLGYGEAITTHVIIHPYFQLRTGLSWRAWVYNYAHIKLWGIITYPDDCRFGRLTATHF